MQAAKSRAFWMDEPDQGRIVELEIPQVGENDGVLRIEAAGVCGTDLKIYHGRFGGRLSMPLIPGHEIVGIVEEIGDRAAERWGVQVGDRVAVDSFLACGACNACLLGDTRYCETLGDYGISMGSVPEPHLYGGFSEYLYLHPAAQVFKLPQGIDPGLGILIPAVISNALRWVAEAGEVGVGSSVLIAGPGPIGLASVAVAKAAGAASVAVCGLPHDAKRLDLATELGADRTIVGAGELNAAVSDFTGGEGFDSVVDVTGSVQSLRASVGAVRRRGIVVAAGLAGAGALAEYPIDQFVLNEVTMRGQFSHDRRAVRQSITFAQHSEVPWERFITHRYPLERTADAIELIGARDPSLIKVVVEPHA